eukprot:jgi/Mesvir1/19813/Mv13103-RA.1
MGPFPLSTTPNLTATQTAAIAYWGFNGDARDYGVNAWNGTIKGSSQYSSSIKYSGTHSLAVTDNTGGLDVTSTALQTLLASDFSLSVFVYFTNNTQQWQSIFTGNAGVQWGLIYNPSWRTTPGFAFFDRGSGADVANRHTWFAMTPTLNTWHHVVVTRQGSLVSMYYDNALKVQTTPVVTKLGPGTSTMCFGNQVGSLPTANFMGYIDQGAIYSSVIDAVTVNSIYTTNAEIITPGALGTVLQQYGSGTDFVRLQLANSGALELETRVASVSRVMDKFPTGNVFVGDAAKHNLVLTRLSGVSAIPASIPCEWLFTAGALTNTGTGSNLAVVSGTQVDVSNGVIEWTSSATPFSSGTDRVTMSLSDATVGLTTFSLIFDYFVDSTKLDGNDTGLFHVGPDTTNRMIGTVGSNGTSLSLNTMSTVTNGDLNIAVADANGVTAVFPMDTWHTVSITRLGVTSESSSAIDNSKLIVSVDGMSYGFLGQGFRSGANYGNTLLFGPNPSGFSTTAWAIGKTPDSDGACAGNAAFPRADSAEVAKPPAPGNKAVARRGIASLPNVPHGSPLMAFIIPPLCLVAAGPDEPTPLPCKTLPNIWHKYPCGSCIRDCSITTWKIAADTPTCARMPA